MIDISNFVLLIRKIYTKRETRLLYIYLWNYSNQTELEYKTMVNKS